MQPTSPSRREFLKQGSGVLIGALVFSSGPIALLAPSKVWALELSALDEATGRALLRFARHLYPHDTMEDAVYAMVVKALDKGAADPGEKKLLVDGVAALDRAAGGDWMAKSPDRQLVAVIGSGAGGGTLANELCQKGVPVVLLEAGKRESRATFVNDEWASFGQLAWTDKRTTSGTWRVARDFPNLPAWTCKAVGGTTT